MSEPPPQRPGGDRPADGKQPSSSAGGPRTVPVRRALAGTAAGGGLYLFAYLMVRIPDWSSVGSSVSCANQRAGCIVLAAGTLAFQAALLLIPWPLLRAAGVRPAWQPALIAVIAIVAKFVLAGGYVSLASFVSQGLLSPLLAAMLYAGSALLTINGRFPRLRALGLVLVLGYVLVARAIGG